MYETPNAILIFINFTESLTGCKSGWAVVKATKAMMTLINENLGIITFCGEVDRFSLNENCLDLAKYDPLIALVEHKKHIFLFASWEMCE